jgi:hypothetical protein
MTVSVEVAGGGGGGGQLGRFGVGVAPLETP